MRQAHRAGERLFVDYAGHTVEVVDPASGEIRTAQIFVAVLGASNYTMAVKVTIRERSSDAVHPASGRHGLLALRKQSRDGHMRLFFGSWVRVGASFFAPRGCLRYLRNCTCCGGKQPGGYRLGRERLKHGPFLAGDQGVEALAHARHLVN